MPQRRRHSSIDYSPRFERARNNCGQRASSCTKRTMRAPRRSPLPKSYRQFTHRQPPACNRSCETPKPSSARIERKSGPQTAARSRTGGARESHCDTRVGAARRSSGSLSDRTRPVSSFSLTALNGASPERCRRGSRVRRAIRCGPIGGTEPGTVGLRLHGSPGRRQLWGHWRLRRDVAPGHRNNCTGQT